MFLWAGSVAAAAQSSPSPVLRSDISWTNELIENGIYAAFHGRETEATTYLTRVAKEAPLRSEPVFFLSYLRWVKAREIGYKGTSEAEKNYAAFVEESKKAIERAKAARKKDPDNAQNLLFLSAIYGYRAQYHLEREEYLSAFFDALPAKRYLEKTSRLDPTLADADLGHGLYEYYLATLPRVVRALNFLMNMRGDKEKGLALMEHAAREGIYVRNEAAWLLQDLLCARENRCADALPWIQKLAGEFPENIQIDLALEKVCMRLRRYEDARRVSESLMERVSHGNLARSWQPYLEYRIALAKAQLGRQEAVGEYERLFRNGDLSIEVKKWIPLRIGTALDLLGERDKAVKQYKSVIDADDAPDEAVRAAKRYLSTPYTRKDPQAVPGVHFMGVTPLREP